MKTKQIATTWLFNLYATLFLLLPWSPDFNAGTWHIRLPAEALTLVAGLMLAYGLFRHPEWLQQVQRRQWTFYAAFAWMIWLTVCVSFSTMPRVSLKYWLVETGQCWVFLVGFVLFRDWWLRLLPFFIYSMLGIVVYTLGHHFQYHFRADQSMLAPMPFFPDHTLYSAVLVMILPSLYLVFKPRTATLWLVLCLTGLFFAYCRAAWLSVGASFLVALALVFHKKWRWTLLFSGMLLTAGMLLKPLVLEKVKQDVSALERFNRYACAKRMAQERPLTGFGPGTFQFQYIPFQQPEERTRISVSNPEHDLQPGQYGRGGGAHSEYFQALAENGRPGLLLWVLLAGTALFTGARIYLSAQNKQDQWFALAITISLFSYLFHAFFNNFLHDGRVALLFWGQVAALTEKVRK